MDLSFETKVALVTGAHLDWPCHAKAFAESGASWCLADWNETAHPQPEFQ